jgi:hypothetical protein
MMVVAEVKLRLPYRCLTLESDTMVVAEDQNKKENALQLSA